MDKVSFNGKIFTYFEYAKECDFEKDVKIFKNNNKKIE